MVNQLSKLAMLACFTLFFSNALMAQLEPIKSIEGRWDITITDGNKKLPSWLEVNHSGLKTLTGQFVYQWGSARPIARIDFTGEKMSFTIPPQWEDAEKDLVVEATLKDGKLTGTMSTPLGQVFNWTGVRAPKTDNSKIPVWVHPLNYSMVKILTDGKLSVAKTNGLQKTGFSKVQNPGQIFVA